MLCLCCGSCEEGEGEEGEGEEEEGEEGEEGEGRKRKGRRSHMIIDKTSIQWNFCIMGRVSLSFIERLSSLRRCKMY